MTLSPIPAYIEEADGPTKKWASQGPGLPSRILSLSLHASSLPGQESPKCISTTLHGQFTLLSHGHGTRLCKVNVDFKYSALYPCKSIPTWKPLGFHSGCVQYSHRVAQSLTGRSRIDRGRGQALDSLKTG